MSPGGYESSSIPSSSSQYDSWRSAAPSAYDRSYNPPIHHSPPSPQQFRRSERYIPPRPANSFRTENYPNVYRPNEYRQSSSSYHNRSPSPDRYSATRGSEADSWDRHTPWQSTSKHSPTWQDTRKPLPPSPTSPVSRDRNRRDNMMATRMFEPSDPWKPPHPDRPHRVETYPDYRPREATEVVNPRNPYPGGDRYRPVQPHRDAHTYEPRSNYDSYRPQYDDGWVSRERRDSTSSIDGNRRESISAPHTRSSSRYDGRRASSPKPVTPISPTNTHSPHRSSRGYSHRSPSRGRRLAPYDDHLPYDSDSSSRKATYSRKPKSRSASRSSIASSHVSEESPPVPQIQPDEPPSSVQASKEFVDNAILVDKASLTCSDVTNALPANGTCSGDPSDLSGCKVSPRVVEQKQLLSNLAPIHVPASPHGQVMSTRTLEASAPSPSPQSANLLVQKSEPHAPDDMAIDDVPFRLDPSLPIAEDKAQTMVVDAPQSEPHIVPPSQPEAEHNLEGTPEAPAVLTPHDTPTNQPQNAAENCQSPQEVPHRVVEIPEEEDVPSLSEARSREEALRIVVMTRLLCDRQTREERVNPVLKANQALSSHSQPSTSTAQDLVKEVTEGSRRDALMAVNIDLRASLVRRFEKRQADIVDNAQNLRKDYLDLHEKWLLHCASLDEQSKPTVAENETAQPPGRTTRRTANLGDAVRSDLEMEQIIASLGNDEATDPNQLSLKNLAKIPEMISVVKGKVDYVYDDTNHLILDPADFYGTHTGIHDWTEGEKEIFLDKFAAYPKQFGIIAAALENKTPAQCVDFYYLHKKSLIDFRKVVQQYAPNKRKRRKLDKKKGNGLIADIHQHDDEVHQDDSATNGRPTRTRRSVIAPEPKKPTSRRNTVAQSEITPTSTPTPEPDARSRRKRGGTATTPSGRATPANQPNQPATDDAEDDFDQDARPAKRVRRPVARKPKSSILRQQETLVQQQQHQETINALSELPPRAADQSDTTPRRKTVPTILWSDEDKSLFLTLLAQHGDDFKRIAASMPNKTTIQVSNYYKSNMVELGLGQIVASAPKRSPTPDATPREGWKEPPYPGFGVMSPSSMEPSTSGSTSASVSLPNVKPSPQITTLPRLPELSRPLDPDPDVVHIWSPATRPSAPSMLSPSPSRSSYPASSHSVANGRPAAAHTGHPGYPIPTSPVPTPSFYGSSPRPVPYPAYPQDAPQYTGPYDGRQQQQHRPPPPPLQTPSYHDPSRRPSINRGENPYPVLPTPQPSGAAISSPPYFVS